MNWLVKNSAAKAAAEQKVGLPDVLVAGEAFPLVGIPALHATSAVWQRAHRTLTLTDVSGVETNIRVRASTLQNFDGDATTQMTLEFVAGSARGVRSFSGTIEPFVPGQANRGRAEAGKALQVRSQITGKVLRILVKPGDQVAAGDTLLIVEAMKMENRIFATQAGTVAIITVKEGESVATGKELVRLANS